MTKKRISIPKTVAEEVLKEYRHKCAMCGRHEPQLHHIDEDPGNNDPVNLIPLCPNCHLQDIHAPTAPLEQGPVYSGPSFSSSLGASKISSKVRRREWLFLEVLLPGSEELRESVSNGGVLLRSHRLCFAFSSRSHDCFSPRSGTDG